MRTHAKPHQLGEDLASALSRRDRYPFFEIFTRRSVRSHKQESWTGALTAGRTAQLCTLVQLTPSMVARDATVRPPAPLSTWGEAIMAAVRGDEQRMRHLARAQQRRRSSAAQSICLEPDARESINPVGPVRHLSNELDEDDGQVRHRAANLSACGCRATAPSVPKHFICAKNSQFLHSHSHSHFHVFSIFEIDNRCRDSSWR